MQLDKQQLHVYYYYRYNTQKYTSITKEALAWGNLAINWAFTYFVGSCKRPFSRRKKVPSTKTPFLPLHKMKKAFLSSTISKCLRLTNLEEPMLTSTSPSLLFRPIRIRLLFMKNSKFLPSSLAKDPTSIFLSISLGPKPTGDLISKAAALFTNKNGSTWSPHMIS